MSEVTRRDFLGKVAITTGALSAGCRSKADAASPPPAAETPPPPVATPEPVERPMPIRDVRALRFPWETLDPFLFCVHHLDEYPAGNAAMGPSVPLAGRQLGQDFSRKDGWSMYHGEVVPGFPRHPHRGFETVTVVRRGVVDHSDSMGATARYGGGDTQWMTAGRGISHAEMFPLRRPDADNTMELFQIWLNLPARSKMVEPHFTMMWSDGIPRHDLVDAGGRKVTLTTVAGEYAGRSTPAPPPDSWASEPGADVAIWTIEMTPGSTFTIPAAAAGLNRALYFFRGKTLDVSGREVAVQQRIDLASDVPAALTAGAEPVDLLLLQGRPIGEPVVQHGPFVMNTQGEIRQAFLDYRRDGFGGWPWRDSAPVHAREQARFAIHADGRKDAPG